MTKRGWWAAPVIVAAVAGGAFAAVALPGLAGGPSVPDQLIVHRRTPPQTTAPQTTAPRTTAPVPAPTTTVARVVVPDRPVVRESGDRGDTNGERSPDAGPDDRGGRGG